MTNENIDFILKIAGIIWFIYDIVARSKTKLANNSIDQNTATQYKTKRKKGVIFYIAILLLAYTTYECFIYPNNGIRYRELFVVSLSVTLSCIIIWERL